MMQDIINRMNDNFTKMSDKQRDAMLDTEGKSP